MKYISHYVFKLIHVSRSFVSFDLIHSILFVSFFFFKSLPVIILSLDQSSIDQSNGSSIDPSTFFFISSLFICIVFFLVPSPSFPSVCPYYILLSSCICISLLEGVHLFSKKIAFPCILLFDSDLFCFAFCAFFHWH